MLKTLGYAFNFYLPLDLANINEWIDLNIIPWTGPYNHSTVKPVLAATQKKTPKIGGFFYR